MYEGVQIEREIVPQAFGWLPNKGELHGFVWKQIFRKNIFQENNLNFMTELQPYEDQILNIDFIRNSKKVYIDNTVIYNYIVNEKSITAKLLLNFNLGEEWDRLVRIYCEKKHRVDGESQAEALSNQMMGFIYSIFLNTAKRMNNSVKSSVEEIKGCCDNIMMKQMICKSSKQSNILDRFVKKCILSGNYAILIIFMRIGLRFRKMRADNI
jgi:hypothetical protein